MSTLGIVEAVEVFKQGHFRPSRCLQSVAPDQLSFEGLEKGLNNRIITVISLATLVHQTSDTVVADLKP